MNNQRAFLLATCIKQVSLSFISIVFTDTPTDPVCIVLVCAYCNDACCCHDLTCFHVNVVLGSAKAEM